MDENPYEAPQVDDIEAASMTEAADSRQAQQYSIFDLRVLAVALVMFAMAYVLPWVLSVMAGSW